MTSRQRLALALMWLAVLLGAGWFVGQHLKPSGDLRKIMPRLGGPTRATKPRAAAAADDIHMPVCA